MRKLIPLLISLFIAGQIYAEDEVSLTVDAPDVVVVGDQFRLTFTVNTQDADNFLAPSISGLSVLAGPYRSSGRNISVINGKMTNVSYLSYAYTLMAEKEGTFTIPAASIEVEGVKIFSNAFAIKVLPPDKSSSSNGNSNAQARGGNASRTQKAGTRIDDDDLFITATANKTKVYEQEAILLTYKVYTTVNLRQLYGKMPDLKGFHTQEVDLPQQKTFSLERYKDRNYNATVWSQYILFPQQTGKLEIPSITFEGIVAQRTAVSDDPFDAFFNGGGYVEVKKNIVTPKLTINVESLPDKNGNLQVLVGQLKSTINIKKLAKNLKRQKDIIKKKIIISSSKVSIQRTNMSPKIDLRGYRIDDALNELDLFLDKASMVNLAYVEIVHGHGTGQLRSAIRDYLSDSPYVAKFRQGEDGEGGNGVTFVDLN